MLCAQTVLFSSLRVRDVVSHPFEIIGANVVLCILMLSFYIGVGKIKDSE
jgi:hypothetical protein